MKTAARAGPRAGKAGSALDEGHTWPTAFALKDLIAADEAEIDALVKKAVS